MDIKQLNNIKDIRHLVEYFVQKTSNKPGVTSTLSYDLLEPHISYLLKEGIALLAKENGNIKGYLLAYKIESLFFEQKGVYTPEFGFVVIDEDPIVKEQLLKKLYIIMKSEGYTHHAISDIATNRDEQFLQLGYALRVMDAVTEVSSQLVDNDYYLTMAIPEDIDELFPIYLEHETYLASSPIFLDITFGRKQLKKALTSNETIYLYYYQQQLLGFTTLDQHSAAGCLLFFDEDTLAIKGTHIHSKLQGKGYGTILLKLIQNKALELGKTRLATDFEIFNTLANAFWPKHFQVVAHSYVRYIG